MENLKRIVEYLGEVTSDPVPNFILKKEIQKQAPSNKDMEALRQSKWYCQLKNEQDGHGSWGNFHSMNPAAAKEQRFVTTEAALRRAREIGLGKEDPCVKKAIALMERYIKGDETWPDRIEKHHDNGKSHLHSRLFITAANLSLFDPENPNIEATRAVCIKQLEKSFVKGQFNQNIWNQANGDYSGTCLHADMVYPLWLVQKENCLNDCLQRQYLRYIWNRETGIYYISNAAPSVTVNLEEKGFPAWLSALEVLSGFSLFSEFVKDGVLEHLIKEAYRLIDGSVKLPPPHPVSGRYAENWRDKNSRKNDLLLRITRTLIKCRF